MPRSIWDYYEATPGNIFTPRVSKARVEFESPPRSPIDMQELRLRVRKSAPLGPDPTIKLELLSPAGRVLDTPIPATVVNNGLVLDGTWEASILPDPSGSALQALLTSINTEGETRVELGALAWNPSLSNQITMSLVARWQTLTRVAANPISLRWTTNAFS